MKQWNHDGSSLEQIVARHGAWSAMSIQLGQGRHTREPEVDHRLKRLVQLAADMSRKPLSECRVLDLACLEGQFGIEFAMQGAREVVLVEIREANLAKAAYAIHELGLGNCRLYQDDVRNLNPAAYGEFDIIICSGILYHLRAQDAANLIRSMYQCCSHLMLLDTFVAAGEPSSAQVDGRDVGGLVYAEHEAGADMQARLRDLWASVDNDSSFWFPANTLARLCAEAGFTSVTQALVPTHPGITSDRRHFVAIKGQPQRVLSSPITDRAPYVDPGLEDPDDLHPAQLDHGLAYRIGKAVLPQSVKDSVKPTLRRMGILKTHEGNFRGKAAPPSPPH